MRTSAAPLGRRQFVVIGLGRDGRDLGRHRCGCRQRPFNSVRRVPARSSGRGLTTSIRRRTLTSRAATATPGIATRRRLVATRGAPRRPAEFVARAIEVPPSSASSPSWSSTLYARSPGALRMLYPQTCPACEVDHYHCSGLPVLRAGRAIHPQVIAALQEANPLLLYDLPQGRRRAERPKRRGLPVRSTPEGTLVAQFAFATELKAARA